MRKWTDKEVAFLRKAYNNEPIDKIALTLGRTIQSVRSKVHVMRKKGMTFDRVNDHSDPINAGEAFTVKEPNA